MRASQVPRGSVMGMVSKMMLPAIWPARVETRQVTKNAKSSLVALADLKLLDAVDCNGEMRMKSPTTWNHMTCGKIQIGPTEGYRPKMRRRIMYVRAHKARLFVYSRPAHTAPTTPAARLIGENRLGLRDKLMIPPKSADKAPM